MEITSLAQLGLAQRPYTLTDPSSGEEITMTLRDLLPAQMAQVTNAVRKPKPKESGRFKAGGVPIFDEDDPQYQIDVTNFYNEQVYRWLLLALVIEYPKEAETDTQKIEALRAALPVWVFSELRKVLQERMGLRESAIAYEKKRLKVTTSDNGSTALA